MNQEFEEILKMLQETHREPIAEAHYAAVRSRVLAQIAAERPSWWRWTWAYGLAALTLAILLFPKVGRTPWSARGPLAPLAAPQISLSASAEGPAAEPAADQGVRPTTAARRKRRPHIAAPAAYQVIGPPIPQPLLVKLVTNDPNVVIYWISGE